MTKNNYLMIAFLLLTPLFLKSQNTGLDKGLAIGNILIQGFSAFKGNGKTVDPNAKTVESFCLKTKWMKKSAYHL